jgi:hypothetical protein
MIVRRDTMAPGFVKIRLSREEYLALIAALESLNMVTGASPLLGRFLRLLSRLESQGPIGHDVVGPLL